jgi:transaldolase
MPPTVYEALRNCSLNAEVRLSSESAKKIDIEKILVDEKNFRWLMNENEVATDKLSEGIRLFSQGYLIFIKFFY